MKAATDETVTVLWTPDRARRQAAARAQRAADAERARRQDAARAQRAADAERVRKELKRAERERQAAREWMEKHQERERQAARERMEKRLEQERQAARERMEKRLQVWGEHTLIDAGFMTGFFVLGLATVVFFILAVDTGGEWLEWIAGAVGIGAMVCGIAWCFTMNPYVDTLRFPPSPEVLDLAMTLPPDAASALEQVLDSSGRGRWLVSSARREQRRRALLVRALHVLGDSAALIVDDAIKQGLDPLTGLLEAAVNAPR